MDPIERESREWFLVCPNCDHATSYWELGGRRAGAKSKGKRILARCRNCRKLKMHRVEHRPSTGDA